MNTFFAYARANGKFGIRNHVAVISAMDNSNFIARRVAACVTGTVEVCPALAGARWEQTWSSTSQPWVGWVLIPMSLPQW
ncbi:MAG: UxaA family hydrolase [Dysosmobacter sp.]